MDRKVAIAISIALLVIGGLLIAFLLAPFFSSSSPSSGSSLISVNPVPQSSGRTVVDNEVTTTATGVYCNCTYSDSGG